MDMTVKTDFISKWDKYFPGAELPITFYYTDQEGRGVMAPPPSAHQCIIAPLAKIRNGDSLCFGAESIGCFGGKRFAGFKTELSPTFAYFLSCGIPGKMEGERYKKTPELVTEWVKNSAEFKAPAKYLVFKRFDKLEADDSPEAVIFFAPPDVLSGLFTLANYEESEANGVFSPFSAGCGTIIRYPYLENRSDRPRGVLGMFDVSARPFVGKDILTFAVPMNRFLRMADNMDESFLITPAWERVKNRISA